jgi:hypothetical protein
MNRHQDVVKFLISKGANRNISNEVSFFLASIMENIKPLFILFKGGVTPIAMHKDLLKVNSDHLLHHHSNNHHYFHPNYHHLLNKILGRAKNICD